MEVLTGLIIGFIGSFHCAGMCGPIAMSLPYVKGSKRNFLAGRLLYNTGRIATYTFLGLVFGLLGNRLNIAGLQQAATISTGVLILGITLLPAGHSTRIYSFPLIIGFLNRLKIAIRNNYKKDSKKALFSIGLLNGFLPCGFVYTGIAGAIITGSIFNGMLFMLLFGLGTMPVMLGISIGGSRIKQLTGRKLFKLIPAFSILLAILFILRGMDIGIPYISPKISTTPSSQTEQLLCH